MCLPSCLEIRERASHDMSVAPENAVEAEKAQARTIRRIMFPEAAVTENVFVCAEPKPKPVCAAAHRRVCAMERVVVPGWPLDGRVGFGNLVGKSDS